ncbi:MAG: GNAT family N-acetyltransferase [bacterium]
MITIKQAQKSDKDKVLAILDDFRTVCMRIIDPESTEVATVAKLQGTPVFLDVINNPQNGAVFIATEGDQCIGIISIYKIPQIRKGVYRAEIEEMFAAPEYHGKGVGAMLIERAEQWASENGIKTIQLISNFQLKRAHNFYAKMGFKETSKSFEKQVQNY